MHDFDGDCMTNFLVSVSEAGVNSEKLEVTSSSSNEACKLVRHVIVRERARSAAMR